MGFDQIGSEALKLPAKERALLAEFLWESLEDPYDLSASLTDDEAVNLAIKRDAEIESGAVKALSHDELMRLLRK